ncbi:MAG: hypothetical protein Ct9H300mP32_1630 [Verrucomicrobiota bacterium]|nr:MAG: hypothetical protein Ct9H300mP32_1630 [Verrucomicrobiota bacterium]
MTTTKPRSTPRSQRGIGRLPAICHSTTSPRRGNASSFTPNWPSSPKAAELAELKEEIRDRFGPIPKPVERLLSVAELKVLAAAKNVPGIEAKGDKIMLTRNGELITLGGKFPRFTKRSPDGRLKEMRTLPRGPCKQSLGLYLPDHVGNGLAGRDERQHCSVYGTMTREHTAGLSQASAAAPPGGRACI